MKGEESMSEAAGRVELERRLVHRSNRDEAFRQRLVENPKAAVEEELGAQLPEETLVVAVEETADTFYLVLPFVSTETHEAGELSDRELEAVAGGWMESDAAHSQAFPTEACGC
jgi:Nitrile hydratase, alpha chain